MATLPKGHKRATEPYDPPEPDADDGYKGKGRGGPDPKEPDADDAPPPKPGRGKKD